MISVESSQRPDIERTVRTDLEIMGRLAELLENHVEGWQAHQPTAVVAEFARRMEQELDFSAEAAGMERFARQFADGIVTAAVGGIGEKHGHGSLAGPRRKDAAWRKTPTRAQSALASTRAKACRVPG